MGWISRWEHLEGRSAIVKNDAFKMFFKVPSLRNIEKTGSYFHDSSAKTLDNAVIKMSKHQLGKELSKQQVAEIVAFLKSLTCEIRKKTPA